MTDTWKAFFPEDGETVEDAWEVKAKTHPVTQRPMFMDAEDAAQRACEMDYDERDGWERNHDSSFLIVVISPLGTHHSFTGRHQPSIDHTVEEVK
jgi:hypothetical protein